MWIIIAIISYFINAGVYIADKFLLSKKVHSSIAYAFYVGIWSIFNFLILIFDPWIPSLRELGVDLLAGGLFLTTLVFWYKALHQSEATRVVPIVGALVPIFSFLLSYIFLGQSLGERQFLAFIILIHGGILISVKQTKMYMWSEVKEKLKDIFGTSLGGVHVKYQPTRRLLLNSVISAFFFASYYVLIKYIYTTQPFIGGFVWSRLGSFLGVFVIFMVPTWRKLIKEQGKDAAKPKSFSFFIVVRVMAALAFIMLNWAISFEASSVALINALQGLQYLFLIVMVLFLSSKYPKVLNEELGAGVLVQKIIGATLVTTGLYMLIT